MKKGYLTMFALTVLIICCMWVSSPGFRQPEVIDANTVFPNRKDIYDSVVSRGKIEDGEYREIRFDSAARINDIVVEIGQTVEEGQLLMKISEMKGSVIPVSMFSGISDAEYEKIKTIIDEYGIDPEEYIPQNSGISFEETERDIFSPISGVITQLNVTENSSFSGYKAAAVVSDMSKIHAKLQIPELYIEKIRIGQDVEISGDAFSKKYRGVVKKIYPTATQKSSLTGTGETVVDTIVEISNPDGKLKPGYSVSAKIYTSRKKQALTLPYSCIQQDEDNREYIYVVKNETAHKQGIRTGLELDNEVEVLSGLNGDEEVVLIPSDSLKDGMRVKGLK